MLGFAFLVAVVAVVVAVFLWLQWQTAASAVSGLRAEADGARKDVEAARAEQKKIAEELKARSAQLQETREKLIDTRKKAQEGKTGKTQTRGAREAELEEDLAHARKLMEEAHASEKLARRDLMAAKAAEQQARSELEKAQAQARVRELSAKPAAAPAPAPAAAMPEVEALRTQLEAAKAELDRQVKQAEYAARDARKREQDLRDEIKKAKGRAETNNRVYLVTKGELELTKERLAQAEHKLWQAGIPLAPPPAKERPKAIGPAAADKPREAAPATPEATAGALPEVAAAGEPIGAGETVSTAAQQSADEGTSTPDDVASPRRESPENGVVKE
jgi:predicted  nucleic acid-binding Zn-ribbon protein